MGKNSWRLAKRLREREGDRVSGERDSVWGGRRQDRQIRTAWKGRREEAGLSIQVLLPLFHETDWGDYTTRKLQSLGQKSGIPCLNSPMFLLS